MIKPLVSIITPTTHDRLHFNERNRRVVKAQNYPNIEHVVSYASGMTLGQKMNDMIALANGEIIVNIDSDDVFAPDWVSRIVECLLDTKADVVGLKKAYFYDFAFNKLHAYTYPDNCKQVHGGTMAHTKDYWRRNKYQSMQVGYDVLFVENDHCKSVGFDYSDGFIATIHPDNTSPKNISGERWETLPMNRELMDLWGRY